VVALGVVLGAGTNEPAGGVDTDVAVPCGPVPGKVKADGIACFYIFKLKD